MENRENIDGTVMGQKGRPNGSGIPEKELIQNQTIFEKRKNLDGHE